MDAPAVCAPQEQRILVGRRREHSLEVPPRLAQMPTDVPEPAQCDRQPQRARLHSPAGRMRAPRVRCRARARGARTTGSGALRSARARRARRARGTTRHAVASTPLRRAPPDARRRTGEPSRAGRTSPRPPVAEPGGEASARPSTSSRARPSSPSTQTVATASSVAPPRKADSRASSSRSSPVSRP